MERAVFVDRDGVISEEVGYIGDREQLRLIPQSAEAVKLINQSGLKIIAITNQSGVARGYFSEEMLAHIHRKMEKLLSGQGAFLDGIYYCPHHPEGTITAYRMKCDCRKPATGLLIQAAQEHAIDVSSSYLVGDKRTDIECAHRAGAKGILVLTGYGKDELTKINKAALAQPHYIAADLLNAVQWIIKDKTSEKQGDPHHKIECNR
jgi:D-glycero-D-manno-heptose 1,7-bisphosphate phosphatase